MKSLILILTILSSFSCVQKGNGGTESGTTEGPKIEECSDNFQIQEFSPQPLCFNTGIGYDETITFYGEINNISMTDGGPQTCTYDGLFFSSNTIDFTDHKFFCDFDINITNLDAMGEPTIDSNYEVCINGNDYYPIGGFICWNN